ncbi:hypothetical protein Mapa_011364 [Marchantia paleacea]|nr:hypothetical protein Mapa_011364 [Marchantia paleacea]
MKSTTTWPALLLLLLLPPAAAAAAAPLSTNFSSSTLRAPVASSSQYLRTRSPPNRSSATGPFWLLSSVAPCAPSLVVSTAAPHSQLPGDELSRCSSALLLASFLPFRLGLRGIHLLGDEGVCAGATQWTRGRAQRDDSIVPGAGPWPSHSLLLIVIRHPSGLKFELHPLRERPTPSQLPRSDSFIGAVTVF